MQQCENNNNEIIENKVTEEDKIQGISVQKLMERIKIFLVMKQLKEDSNPCLILPNLFLGCLGCALNKKKLVESNIKFILSACDMPKAPFPEDFTTLVINVNDSVEQEMKSKFDQSNAFIDEAIGQQQNILVHCFAGKSRSTTFIIAYLIKKHSMTVIEALELIKTKRPIAQPNPGFMKQLQEYYDLIHQQ